MYGTYYKRATVRTEISMMLIFLIFCNYYKLSSTLLCAGGDVLAIELSHISLFRDYAPNYFPGNISHTEKAESKVWYALGDKAEVGSLPSDIIVESANYGSTTCVCKINNCSKLK